MDKLDGFYSAYFTGTAGNAIAMFIFRSGTIVGADAGGGKYDGQYALAGDGQHVDATVRFILPIGSSTITGVAAQAEPLSLDVPLRLPLEFNRNDVHRIETPLGPLDAKFEKIRGL